MLHQNSPMRIHIGHPLGRTTQAARNLADALDGLGGGSIRASCSASLALDQHWPTRAGEVLRATHWLLLIFGERSLDRDWWLWEAGFFAAVHSNAARRIVCLHHPDLNVPRTLHAWRTLPATPTQTDGLLQEIFDSHNSAGHVRTLPTDGKGLNWLKVCLMNCCLPLAEAGRDQVHAG